MLVAWGGKSIKMGTLLSLTFVKGVLGLDPNFRLDLPLRLQLIMHASRITGPICLYNFELISCGNPAHLFTVWLYI